MGGGAKVGRVTPCAPFFANPNALVAIGGGQRTARPTCCLVRRERARGQFAFAGHRHAALSRVAPAGGEGKI